MHWFKFAGGKWFLIFQILFLILDRGLYVMTELWLATWTSATENSVKFLGFEIPSQQVSQDPWIIVYASLIFASFIAVAMRTEWAIYGGSRAARKLWREVRGAARSEATSCHHYYALLARWGSSNPIPLRF